MFPSVINTFNIVSPTDRLNSPSHSALHNDVSSVLTQVQTFVGRVGSSSTAGTLAYDVRSPDSDGGGHVQSANKGGTGQTSYTKGDILVASSNSVLTKLAVGADGQSLFANSSTASGIQWGTGVGNAGTIIPWPSGGAGNVATGQISNSVLGYTGLVSIPYNISVNKISAFAAGASSDAAASARIGIYTENGQTQVTSMMFSSVANTTIVSQNVSSVFIAAGNYWVVTVPVYEGIAWARWRYDSSPFSNLGPSVIGKIRLSGVQSVTAGTLPTSFNPASLGADISGAATIRLDN